MVPLVLSIKLSGRTPNSVVGHIYQGVVFLNGQAGRWGFLDICRPGYVASSPAAQNVEPNCGEIENKNSERYWVFCVQIMRGWIVMLCFIAV
jgi:hypothetical protein